MSKLNFDKLKIKKPDFKKSENKPPSKKTKPLIVAMSVVIILCGLYFLIKNLTKGVDCYPGEQLSNIVMLVGGALAIILYRHDIRMGTAVNLITLGSSYILSDIFVVVTMKGLFEALDSLTYVVCGVVLLYYGLSLLFGVTSGSLKGFVCLAALTALEIVPIILSLHQGMFVLQVIVKYADSIVLCIMNILLLIILSRKEMMLPTFVKRVRTNSDLLFDELNSDPKAYINRYNLKTLTEPQNTVGWKMLESGPIERERIIPLFDNRGETEIVLQMWKDDPRLHLTVRRTKASSYNILLSLVVEQLILDNPDPALATKVRMYAKDGVFIDIIVKDREEDNVGYVGTIKRKIQLKRNKKLIEVLGKEIKGFVGNDEEQ